MNLRTLALLALFTLPSAAALAQPPVTVETDSAKRESVAPTMNASGVVVSREDAAIASELNGRLEWIAEVGDRFQQGDIIARLDQHLIELEEREREASIKALKANLDWLKRQTNRLDELATSNNTAHSELDETRARYLVLEQELTQAQVALERTRYNLERSTVRAPFDGVVVSRDMAAGEFATTGRSLLRLVNTRALEVSVTAPLRLARFNRAGDTLQLSNGDMVAEAHIRSLVEVGDLRSHMMELRLTPTTQDWLIGEAVTVELPASRVETTTTVARDAVVLRDRSNYVYVVTEDSTAQRVSVELGAGVGERIAIRGAIQPGDAVVVRGAENLRDGQKVNALDQQVTLR
ncbi:MAG: efflux RND transporter periplasmic adaptor subunit [Halieaceae bacterium]|nr:efflux RND transporter periplasmic adaptor subunit [Halieaceae bacterium]